MRQLKTKPQPSSSRWLDRTAQEFWDVMHHRRNDLNLTQTQVAERLGMHQSTVSGWERGRVRRLPSPAHFWALSDLLQLSGSEMLEAAGYL